MSGTIASPQHHAAIGALAPCRPETGPPGCCNTKREASSGDKPQEARGTRVVLPQWVQLVSLAPRPCSSSHGRPLQLGWSTRLTCAFAALAPRTSSPCTPATWWSACATCTTTTCTGMSARKGPTACASSRQAWRSRQLYEMWFNAKPHFSGCAERRQATTNGSSSRRCAT